MTLSVLKISFKLLFFLIVSVPLVHQVASQEEKVETSDEEILTSEEEFETSEEEVEAPEEVNTSDEEDYASEGEFDILEEDDHTSEEKVDASEEVDTSKEEVVASEEVVDTSEKVENLDDNSDDQDVTLFDGDYDGSDDDENSGEVEPLRPPECGYNTYKLQRKRVVSSFKVGKWPWIGALGYESDQLNADSLLCGATLISSRHVLTAGHCVYEKEDGLIVRFGEYDLSDDHDGAIDIPVEKVTIHPDYVYDILENDIAILELTTEVDFTDDIHPICLPVEDDIKNRNFVNNHLFTAGWGASTYQGPASNILRETHIPVVDEETCLNDYSKFKEDFVIDDRVICAGYPEGGRDTCQGDSGGPLVYFQTGYFYLIGIVSSGHHCGEPNTPGLYTRVTAFLDFIMSNMN